MTGAQLKQRRRELKHSLASASRELGISARTIARWESLLELPSHAEKISMRLKKNETAQRQ